MKWYDYLRRVRQEKLDTNRVLGEGRVRLHRTEAGVTRDTTDEAIQENVEHIAEIEAVLTMAGEPIEGPQD